MLEWGSRVNKSLHAESPVVIAHLAHRVRHAEQGAHLGAKAPVGEPGDGVHEGAQSAGQGHDPRVAKPQGWGPPTIADGWSRDPLKGWARKDTALADTESIDHAAVDVTGFDR